MRAIVRQGLAVDSYSAGIDFKRHYLTSKVDSRAVRVKNIYNGHRTIT